MAITSKEINLSQLDQELGGQGLVADFNDSTNKIIKPADNSTVTEAQVTQLNREQGLAKLKELGFTDAEISALLGGN